MLLETKQNGPLCTARDLHWRAAVRSTVHRTPLDCLWHYHYPGLSDSSFPGTIIAELSTFPIVCLITSSNSADPNLFVGGCHWIAGLPSTPSPAIQRLSPHNALSEVSSNWPTVCAFRPCGLLSFISYVWCHDDWRYGIYSPHKYKFVPPFEAILVSTRCNMSYLCPFLHMTRQLVHCFVGDTSSALSRVTIHYHVLLFLWT